DLGAHLQPGELVLGAAADNDFVLAPVEHAAGDDLHIVAHLQGGALDAAKGDVGVSTGGALGKIDHDEKFGGSERSLGGARDVGSVGDHAGGVAIETADHFTVRAAAEDDGGFGRNVGGHRLAESGRDGEHADQDANNAGDTEDRGRNRAATLRNGQQPELGDGADLRNPVERSSHYILLKASATRRRMA